MAEHDVTYAEIHGKLEPGELRRPHGDLVVLSNLEQGKAITQAAKGVCIRYVGRGREDYRIGRRAHRLGEGQILISPHSIPAEAEIARNDRLGTFGLCVLLRDCEEEVVWADGSMLFGSECTPLGKQMERAARRLSSSSVRKRDAAAELAAVLRCELSGVARKVIRQAAAVEAVKPATRYEMVRRATLAQAYLHSTARRIVSLHELAGAIGYSPFQLLRAFQHCFGDTPAGYHRKLRLQRVVDEAQRRHVPISSVAAEFGFGDASSFSHAYRRAFGRSFRG